MATLAEAPAEYEKENASPEPAKEPAKRPADETTQQPKKSKQKLTHRYEQADDEIDAAVAREWRELVQACAKKLGRSPKNVKSAYINESSLAAQLDALGSVTASRIVKLANQDERTKKEQKFIAVSVLRAQEEKVDKQRHAGANAALGAVVEALAKEEADKVTGKTKLSWLSLDKLKEKRDAVSFGNPGDWSVYTQLNERIQELKKERTKGSPRTPQ